MPKTEKKIFKDEDIEMVITNFEAVNFLQKKHSTVSSSIQSLLTSLLPSKIEQQSVAKISEILSHNFTNRIAMSGTPNSNTILDVWHPALLVDDGDRLGTLVLSVPVTSLYATIQWLC